jgi:hypothetical protein
MKPRDFDDKFDADADVSGGQPGSSKRSTIKAAGPKPPFAGQT